MIRNKEDPARTSCERVGLSLGRRVNDVRRYLDCCKSNFSQAPRALSPAITTVVDYDSVANMHSLVRILRREKFRKISDARDVLPDSSAKPTEEFHFAKSCDFSVFFR